VFVARGTLDRPDSAWHELRTRLTHDSAHYLMMLVRAEGVGTFGEARRTVQGSNLDVGYEPLFGDGDLRFRKRRKGP
jgi:hypothetical protein